MIHYFAFGVILLAVGVTRIFIERYEDRLRAEEIRKMEKEWFD